MRPRIAGAKLGDACSTSQSMAASSSPPLTHLQQLGGLHNELFKLLHTTLQSCCFVGAARRLLLLVRAQQLAQAL